MLALNHQNTLEMAQGHISLSLLSVNEQLPVEFQMGSL
jgi:hypothetical protein